MVRRQARGHGKMRAYPSKNARRDVSQAFVRGQLGSDGDHFLCRLFHFKRGSKRVIQLLSKLLSPLDRDTAEAEGAIGKPVGYLAGDLVAGQSFAARDLVSCCSPLILRVRR